MWSDLKNSCFNWELFKKRKKYVFCSSSGSGDTWEKRKVEKHEGCVIYVIDCKKPEYSWQHINESKVRLKENVVDFGILPNVYRLTVPRIIDTKGAKRSVNVRATNLCKGFFKNVLLDVNRRPPKMRSLHTYGVVWIHWCVVNCILCLRENNATNFNLECFSHRFGFYFCKM